MAPNRITYKQLDEMLLHLGFSRQRVEDKWLRYEHKPSDLMIVVAAKEPSELVRVTDAVSARRHLVEKGSSARTPSKNSYPKNHFLNRQERGFEPASWVRARKRER